MSATQDKTTLKNVDSKSRKVWTIISILNFIIALVVVGYIVVFDFIVKKEEEATPPKVIARYEHSTIDRFNNVLYAMFGYEEDVNEDIEEIDRVMNDITGEVIASWAHAFEEAEVSETSFYKLVVLLETYHGKYFNEGITFKDYFGDDALDKKLKAAGLPSIEEYNNSGSRMFDMSEESGEIVVDTERYAVYVDYYTDLVFDVFFDIVKGDPYASEEPSIFSLVFTIVDQAEELGVSFEQLGRVFYHGIDKSLEAVGNSKDLYLIIRNSFDAPSGEPTNEDNKTNAMKALILNNGLRFIEAARTDWGKMGIEYISEQFASMVQSVHTIVSLLSELNPSSTGSIMENVAKTIKNENDTAGIEAAGKMIQNLLLSYKYQLDNSLVPVYDNKGNITGTQFMSVSDSVQIFFISLETDVMTLSTMSSDFVINFRVATPLMATVEMLVNTSANVLLNAMSVFEDIEYCKQMALNVHLRYKDREENRTFDVSSGNGIKNVLNYLVTTTNLKLDSNTRFSEEISGMYNVTLTAEELTESAYKFFLDLERSKIINNDEDVSGGLGMLIPMSDRDYKPYASILGKALANRAGVSFEEYDEDNGSYFVSTFSYYGDVNFEEIGNFNEEFSDDELLGLVRTMLVRYFYFLDDSLLDLVGGNTEIESIISTFGTGMFNSVNKIVIPTEASESEIITTFKLVSAAFSTKGTILPISHLSKITMQRDGFTDKLISEIIISLLSIVSSNVDQLEDFIENLWSMDINLDDLTHIPLKIEELNVNGVVGKYLACKWVDGRYLTLATDTEELIQLGEINTYLPMGIDNYEFILYAVDTQITNDKIIIKKGEIKYRLKDVGDEGDGNGEGGDEGNGEGEGGDGGNGEDGDGGDGGFIDELFPVDYISLGNGDISENVLVNVLINNIGLSQDALDAIAYSKSQGTLINLEVVFEEVAAFYKQITKKNALGFRGGFVNEGVYDINGAVAYMEQMIREIQLRRLIEAINIKIIHNRTVDPNWEAVDRLDISTTYDSTATSADIMNTNHQIMSQLVEFVNNSISVPQDQITYESGYNFYQTFGLVIEALNQIEWLTWNQLEMQDVSLGIYNEYSITTIVRIVNDYNSKVEEAERIEITDDFHGMLDALEVAYGKDFGSQSESIYNRLLKFFDSRATNSVSLASLYLDRLIDTNNSSALYFNTFKPETRSKYKEIGLNFLIYPENDSDGYDFIHYQLYKMAMQFINVADSPFAFSFLTNAVSIIGSFEITALDDKGNIVRFGEDGYFDAINDAGHMFYSYSRHEFAENKTIVQYELDWEYNRGIQHYFETLEDFIAAAQGCDDPNCANNPDHNPHRLGYNTGVLRQMWEDNASVRTVFETIEKFKDIISFHFDVEVAGFGEVWNENWFGINDSNVYDGLYDFMAQVFGTGKLKLKIGGEFKEYSISKQMLFNSMYKDNLDIYKGIIGVFYYLQEFPVEVLGSSLKHIFKSSIINFSPMLINMYAAYMSGN